MELELYIDTFSEENYYLFFLIFELDHKNFMRHLNSKYECVGNHNHI